jgi:tetratricopeptide (TPR) repeat protein
MKKMNTRSIGILSAFTFFALFLNPFASYSQTETNGDQKFRSANQYFVEKAYRHALQIFLDLESTNKEDATLNYKIGVCYLNTVDKSKSLPYLERAAELGKGKIDFIDMEYYLGRAFHLNHQFEQAINHYTLFKKKLDPKNESEASEIRTIEKYIINCQNGILLTKHPAQVTIEHLPLTINTGFAEFSPVISKDGNTLFFASRRHTSAGGQYSPFTYEYNEDIFIAKKENGHWSSANPLGDKVNGTFHEAPLSISADGNKLFFYKSDHGHDYGIFSSCLLDAKWSVSTSVGSNINSADLETGFCISPDGRKVYFASDRPGGYGGVDIYYSEKKLDGNWGPAVNLGPEINTSHDENFPFISWDGKKLFFSSDGHNSLGGFDLFFSTIDHRRKEWNQAKNLGFPINTADDELSITFSEDESYALYSARHEDSYGDEDIYIIRFQKEDVKAPSVKESHHNMEFNISNNNISNH